MKKLLFIIAFLFSFISHAQATTYPAVDIYYDGDSKIYGDTFVGGTPACNDGSTTTGCVAESPGHVVANATEAQATYNEPAEVQLQMQQAFGSSVTVENRGVPGATVLDSINGSADPISGAPEYDCSITVNASGTCGPLGTRLQAAHALVVVGSFLTNDDERMTPAQYGQYVATWINTVQALRNADGNPMVAVWELGSPNCRLDAPSAASVAYYLQAAEAAAAAANPPVLVIDNYDWVTNNYDWRPHQADCVHPDNGLYSTMGDQAATAMGATVQALLGHPGI